MNGNYPYDDPLALTRVRHKSAYLQPRRRRPAILGQDMHNTSPHSSANAPGGLRRVWNVVSNLVQALNDARDDLLTLLTCDSSVRGGQPPSKSAVARSSRLSSRSPCRSLISATTTTDSRRSRSPTRGEGLGISNNNSHDYSYDHQKSSSLTHHNPPVSFGMNLEFENVQRARSPPADDRQRLSSSARLHTTNQQKVTIPRNNNQYALDYDSPYPPSACGERRRRPCSATRYADLLKEETYHLRERRLAEEYLATPPSRPSWY